MNLIEAAENYLEKTKEFQKSVEEILGEDWTVLVHSINMEGHIPVSIWSKQGNPDFEKNEKVYSLDFLMGSDFGVIWDTKHEEEQRWAYSYEQMDEARKAILRVLEEDKSFIEKEIERFENRSK